ncbi:WXG100 family type VII secretion target [Rhodococcus sp. PvR099]|uniref:WXG100 family type VII secretion target n=1 Tax=Rhodococcus sp. PvR099 TaxID=2806602 RepID=UPI001AEA4A05|nr:WXG100 family type VII secretion target [Rhodococcus sp. PvR099]MBP1162446.1 hypothetical protein [Rhodococcus sp. PvR099]
MSRPVWVDPDGLRSAAPRFEAVADALDRTRTQLSGALQAEGASWGSDETGAAFAEGYVPGADSAVDGLLKVAEAMRAIAGAVTETADAFDGSDRGFAGSLSGPA